MHGAFRQERRRNVDVLETIKTLFWLQAEPDFTLLLRWVRSEDNKDADNLTRPEAAEHVRLMRFKFDRLWHVWGGFNIDLIATETSPHSGPAPVAGRERYQLPLFSRYHTAGITGVDELSQQVGKLPSTDQECVGFGLPPPSMVGVVLSHIRKCQARAVIPVPDIMRSWFPLLASATIPSEVFSRMRDEKKLFRSHPRDKTVPFNFRLWRMRAVEVDVR